MGHNLGMIHDFEPIHGGWNGPCDNKGIMSYGNAPLVWSTCSKNDFLAHYNKILNDSIVPWCLEGKFLLTLVRMSELWLQIFKNALKNLQ